MRRISLGASRETREAMHVSTYIVSLVHCTYISDNADGYGRERGEAMYKVVQI